MEAGRETKLMSSVLRNPRRLILRSSRDDKDFLVDSDTNSESSNMNDGQSSEEESPPDDSDDDDNSENEKLLIMKGIRRSRVLDKLSHSKKLQLENHLSESISNKTAKTLLSGTRFKYLKEIIPQKLSLSDDGDYMIVFCETCLPLPPAGDFLSEESRNSLKSALGPRRKQGKHVDCWTFVVSDIVSALFVLHGWEENYVSRCTSYLLQKVDPYKYDNSHQYREGAHHQCHGMDLETGLVYVKKFGILRQVKRLWCTEKWNPVEDEDMNPYTLLEVVKKRAH